MMEKLKTIGISIVTTLVLSLVIGAITTNNIIRGVLLGVLVVIVGIILNKFKKPILIIILPALVSAIASFFIPGQIQWVIVAIIFSFIATANLPKMFKVVFYMLMLTTLLTWILPISYFQYDLVTAEQTQVGLFSLLNYPTIALSYFGNVALYVLVIGMFYGVLHNISAYRTMLDKIVDKAKGKESIVLGVIIAVIAILTSVCGAAQGIWVIIPFVISLVLLMGYNKITAAMVTIAPISVGLIGSTFASTYITEESGNVVQNGMGIVNAVLETNANNLIGAKIILLILGIAIVVAGILTYASKNKVEKVDESLLPVVTDKKTKIWPLVLVFDLIFIVIILSLTSWTSVFGLNWFQKATEWVTSFEIFGFPITNKLLGGIKAFENWSIDDISALLVVGIITLGLIYKIKAKELINNVASGAKKALKPAALIVLAYVVLVIVSYHPIVLTMIKPLLSNKFNVLTMSVSAFMSSVFNVDLYYSTSTTLPYVTSLISDKGVYALIALVWQTIYGFAVLVGPTSIVMIPVLSYLDVSYGKWLKSNWKTILSLLALIFITLVVTMILV